jgi:hypothetical protein
VSFSYSSFLSLFFFLGVHAGAEKGSCGEDRGKGQDRNFVIDQNLQPNKQSGRTPLVDH